MSDTLPVLATVGNRYDKCVHAVHILVFDVVRSEARAASFGPSEEPRCSHVTGNDQQISAGQGVQSKGAVH